MPAALSVVFGLLLPSLLAPLAAALPSSLDPVPNNAASILNNTVGSVLNETLGSVLNYTSIPVLNGTSIPVPPPTGTGPNITLETILNSTLGQLPYIDLKPPTDNIPTNTTSSVCQVGEYLCCKTISGGSSPIPGIPVVPVSGVGCVSGNDTCILNRLCCQTSLPNFGVAFLCTSPS